MTTNEPLVIERLFNAPVSRVWAAITSNDEMKHWYFSLADFRPEKGFQFSFTGGNEERKYLHLCTITEVVPLSKIAYTWRYDGLEADTLVTIELFEEGERTRLKLTHSGLETFANNGPDFARPNFAAGWTKIIGTSLKNYLEGNSNGQGG